MIRADSIRTALNDLRALDHEACVSGAEGREMGRHLPSLVQLDDGSRLEIGMKRASDGGDLMGVFVARRVWPRGGTKVYSI